jgi:hypothetical protein
MNTRFLLFGFLVPLFCACTSEPPAAPGWRSIELSFGPQDLPEDSWAPLDARVRGALTWSGRKPEWPCGIEFGVQYAHAESQDDSVASSADFVDFRVGAAFEWRPSEWLRIVCGAGPRLGLVSATRPGAFLEVTEDDSSVGVYAHAGAFARVVGGLSLGLDAQWADGSDYDVLGESRDAATAELLLALRWDY